MKLPDAWRRVRALWARAWPLWSVRVSAFGAILTGIALGAPDALTHAWASMPAEVRATVPDSWARAIPTILFVATIVVRLIPQRKGVADDARP